MRRLFLLVLLVCGGFVSLFTGSSTAEVSKTAGTLQNIDEASPVSVLVIDFVKIKDGKRAEALYFYENNWKMYRQLALKDGYIKSFRLLKMKKETVSDFDLILITEYGNDAQYKQSEERFNTIIKATRPDGPKLLNNLKPADFRTTISSKVAESESEGYPPAN